MCTSKMILDRPLASSHPHHRIIIIYQPRAILWQHILRQPTYYALFTRHRTQTPPNSTDAQRGAHLDRHLKCTCETPPMPVHKATALARTHQVRSCGRYQTTRSILHSSHRAARVEP